MCVLVWLEWKESCFRANASDCRYLKSLLPRATKFVWVHSERAFLRALPHATHVIVWNFDPAWFARAPKLKVLATPAAGRELVPEVGPRGIKIHFGHFHGPLMAENVAAFILGWARGFFLKYPSPWPRTWLADKVTDVAGTKAIVFGYGHVGRAIGEKLTALGIEVFGVHRSTDRHLVLSHLKSSEWVILALPSTTGTDNFVDAAFLKKLPRKAVLINVGRGNSVDEVALAKALREKRIKAAYLDVRKYEPSGTVPRFGANNQELEKLDNCILTPHSSAFSVNYIKLCFKELVSEW